MSWIGDCLVPEELFTHVFQDRATTTLARFRKFAGVLPRFRSRQDKTRRDARTRQAKTGQDKGKSRLGKSKTRKHKTRQGKTRQDKPKGMIRLDKSGQTHDTTTTSPDKHTTVHDIICIYPHDKKTQDKTRQGKTR